MDNLFIRNLQLHEMPFLTDLATKEGWNPGINDAEFFFRADPNAYLVIFENEQPAGCISTVNYNDQFGFIGSHIIISEFRNRGIGTHLLNAAIQKLGNINIGLNCFENQITYYEKFGFKPSHKILTFEGKSDAKLIMADRIVSPFMHPYNYIEDYEKKCFPVNRKTFLMNWLNQPKSLLLAKLNEKSYSGFGLLRPCLNGYKLSPLYGDNYNDAEELFLALVGHIEAGYPFFIDLPEVNDGALLLAEKHNLKKVNEAVRMYKQSVPEISVNNIYSFSSFELG